MSGDYIYVPFIEIIIRRSLLGRVSVLSFCISRVPVLDFEFNSMIRDVIMCAWLQRIW